MVVFKTDRSHGLVKWTADREDCAGAEAGTLGPNLSLVLIHDGFGNPPIPGRDRRIEVAPKGRLVRMAEKYFPTRPSQSRAGYR